MNWSFRARLKTLKYGLMLSPFAMAMLVMIEVTVSSMTTSGSPLPASGLEEAFQDTVQTHLLFGAETLVWGYVCVGLGLGLYKLLQRLLTGGGPAGGRINHGATLTSRDG